MQKGIKGKYIKKILNAGFKELKEVNWHMIMMMEE